MASIGEELNVKVGAATADFQSSMERVEDKLEEVADESNSTSRSFSQLSASTSGLTASMGVLGSGLTASAIPAFLTLSTILAPLTVTIGGLAAAAASLGAVFGGLALAGVVTHTSELQSAMKEARQEIIQIIQPLGEVFGPLLVDAVEALPSLVQAIVDSLGPLDQFRSSLVEMGQTAARLIPRVTAVMFDLAEEALPVLNQALAALETQGPGIFRELTSVFNQMLPLVVDLGSAIASLLPDILELGTTVANLVLPALTGMANALGNVISRVNELRPGMSQLVASAVVLAPILSTIGSMLVGLSTPVLVLVGALAALGAAYETNIFGFREAVNSVIPSFEEFQEIGTTASQALIGVIQSLRSEIELFARAGRRVFRGITQFIQTFVAPAFRFVFGQLIAPLLSTVAGIMSRQLGPVVREVSQTIIALTKHLRTIGSVFQTVWKAIDGVVTPIISSIGDALSIVLGTALQNIIESMKLVMNLIQGDFGAALGNLETIVQNSFEAAFDLVGIAQDGFNTLVQYLRQDAADDIIAGIEAFGNAFETLLAGSIDLAFMMGGLLVDLGDYLVNDAIDDIVSGGKKALTIFGNLFEDAFESAVDLVAAIGNVIGEVGDYLVNDAVPAISDSITSLGENIANDLIDAINSILPSDIDVPQVTIFNNTPAEQTIGGGSIPLPQVEAAQTGGFISEGGLLNVHEGERVVPTAQVTDRGTVNVENGGPTEVMVTVEGDTDVIRNVSTQVVKERERRIKRQTGGSTQI